MGVVAIRDDPAHEMVGSDAAEGCEECVERLHEPLSMLLAQFGTKQPSVLKMRVFCNVFKTFFCLSGSVVEGCASSTKFWWFGGPQGCIPVAEQTVPLFHGRHPAEVYRCMVSNPGRQLARASNTCHQIVEKGAQIQQDTRMHNCLIPHITAYAYTCMRRYPGNLCT